MRKRINSEQKYDYAGLQTFALDIKNQVNPETQYILHKIDIKEAAARHGLPNQTEPTEADTQSQNPRN